MPDTKTRTIEVHTEYRSFEVSNIPADAKITYGGVRPDQPGSKTNTLRIYKGSNGQNHQLAVFREVLWFRDKSLDITEIAQPNVKKDWV